MHVGRTARAEPAHTRGIVRLMPTSMRCVVLQSFGEEPKILTRGERPVPEPGPGQARIRMAMSPIYNHDLAIVHGVYGYQPTLPAVPGTESTGAIDSGGRRIGAQDRPTGDDWWGRVHLGRVFSGGETFTLQQVCGLTLVVLGIALGQPGVQRLIGHYRAGSAHSRPSHVGARNQTRVADPSRRVDRGGVST